MANYRSALQFFFARPGQIVTLNFKQFGHLRLRKGTYDLDVALSSLGGEFDALREHLPGSFDGVIVDAGGYTGTAALAFHAMFPKAQILTIEPSSRNLELLRWNVRDIDQIEVLEGALVPFPMDDIWLWDTGDGEWALSTISSATVNEVGLEATSAFTISQLGYPVGSIGLLKLDIEGGERDLFKEAGRDLACIPLIYVELHDYIAPGSSEAILNFPKIVMLLLTELKSGLPR